MTSELKPTALDLACQTLAGFHPELRDAPELLRDARAELAQLRRAPSEAVGLLREVLHAWDNASDYADIGVDLHGSGAIERIRRFLAAQEGT